MSRFLFIVFILLSLNIKHIYSLFLWNHFLAACHCHLSTKFPIIIFNPTEPTTTTTTTKKTKKTKKTRTTTKRRCCTTKKRCCTTTKRCRAKIDPRLTGYPRGQTEPTFPSTTEIIPSDYDYDYYESDSTQEPESYEDTYSEEYSVEISSSICRNTIAPCPANKFTASSDSTNPNGVLSNGCPCRDIEKILWIMQLIMEDMNN